MSVIISTKEKVIKKIMKKVKENKLEEEKCLQGISENLVKNRILFYFSQIIKSKNMTHSKVLIITKTVTKKPVKT